MPHASAGRRIAKSGPPGQKTRLPNRILTKNTEFYDQLSESLPLLHCVKKGRHDAPGWIVAVQQYLDLSFTFRFARRHFQQDACALQSVVWRWPHSLQVKVVRLSPGASLTRLATPHFPHFTSRRVSPFLMAMDFFSIASRIMRSRLARSASFDMNPVLSLLVRLSPRRRRVSPSCPVPFTIARGGSFYARWRSPKPSEQVA